MSIYEELEEKRLVLYQKYQKNKGMATVFYALTVLPILLVLLVIITANNSVELEQNGIYAFLILFFILIVVGSVFSSKAYKVSRTFSNLVKEEFVNKYIKTMFKESYYSAKSHIAINAINDAGLVKRPDRFSGEDLIEGKYKDIKFSVSDIDLKERHEVRTKNGTHVSYVTYFKGRWYIYEFPKNFNQTIKIVESRFGTITRGLSKYETEMYEFNKKFSIYSSDEHFFYYLVKPYLIERMLLLEKSHNGSIYYCFKDNKLHIGVNDKSDSLKVAFNKPVNEENLKVFVEDLQLIKTIVDEFRLYDQKFKN